MEITSQEHQNRILTINTLTRDYLVTVGIVIAANLVTLTLISFGSSSQLAISAMIITSFIFAVFAGGSHLGMIVEFYKDTEEAIFTKKIKNNHVGQLMKNTPTSLWKILNPVCFLFIAITQLYEIWS